MTDVLKLFSYADNIEHYRVCKDRAGNITVDKETYFQDLISLIKVIKI